jgi:hypothetical protein
VNEAIDITPVIQQRLAWDIISCEEIDDMWDRLNLVAPSEDVAEAAHTESHARMDTVEPIGLVGEVYIALTADIISKVMAKHWEDSNGEPPSETELSVMKEQNGQVIKGAVFPIIAHLMETGMLQLGPTVLNGTNMRLI